MTAVVAILKKDGVIVYTDGACYGRGGQLLLKTQKADVLLDRPCILATRGDSYLGVALRSFCDIAHYEVASAFDGMVDAMPQLMRKVAEFGPTIGRHVEINLSAVFGGWSERSQSWELYRISFCGDEMHELVKATWGYWIEPEPPRELLEQRGLIRKGVLDLRGGWRGDDAAIIRYMQAQRETPFKFGFKDGDLTGCIVGAFIQKTTLTRDQATTEIIHRWPDQIGKPLGFSGDVADRPVSMQPR